MPMPGERCEALQLAVQLSMPRRGRYVNNPEDRWQSGTPETLARRAELEQRLEPMDTEDGFGDCLTDIIVEDVHYELFACGGCHRRSWKYEVMSSASVCLYIVVVVVIIWSIIRCNRITFGAREKCAVPSHRYGWWYAHPSRVERITMARLFLSHGCLEGVSRGDDR